MFSKKNLLLDSVVENRINGEILVEQYLSIVYHLLVYIYRPAFIQCIGLPTVDGQCAYASEGVAAKVAGVVNITARTRRRVNRTTISHAKAQIAIQVLRS